MNISAKNLTAINFKGIKHLTVDFSNETAIIGDNASGKTSVFDAFNWLLFGKDSSDRKDFNIKPLDPQGKTTDKVESEVSAILLASGVEMHLKRIFKEKWQKKKGEEVSEFVGNETLYYWNDVPLQQKEYMSKIETLVDEGVFKLITNPLYFNSLKWQDRRSVLLGIAGQISDVDVLDSIATLSNKAEIANLTSVLNQGKTLSEYKKEISAKKKKANDDLKMIPSRIDEAVRSKPESENYDAIRASIKRLTSETESIDEQIGNKAKAHGEKLKLVQEKQKQLYALKSQLNAIEHSIREEIRDRNRKQDDQPLKLRRDISSLEVEISNIAANIETIKRRNIELEATLQPGREQWTAENAKELKFNDEEFHCPACKRAYETEDIESTKQSMTTNFNEDKLKRLASIQSKGKQTKQDLEDNQVRISEKEREKAELTEKMEVLRAEFQKLTTAKTGRLEEKDELSAALLANSEYASLTLRINDLQADIDLSNQPVKESEDDKNLKVQKATLSQSIGELNQKLAGEEQIKRTDKRIEELKDQERSLAQIIAEYDGSEFVIEALTKAKMNIMESRINSKFKLARFRMFKTQVNGGEEETCETMYRESADKPLVPWSGMNTAAKIQVGIDIINALSEFYNVTAPIWIDNRESTVRIPETESQVVNLIVKEGAPLTVLANHLEYATV